jgi:hypothetical protein
MDLLRDPIWQFVGTPLSVLGLLLAFWIYVRQSKYRELAVGLISSHSLLSISQSIAHRIAITLDGRPVSSVYSQVYALKNSGTLPISIEDFIRPVRLNFPADSKVLTAHVSEERPTKIGLKVVCAESTVTLKPIFLNPQDTIEIQVLVSSNDGVAAFDMRVKDASKFVAIHPGKKSKRNLLRATLGIFFLASSFYFYAASTPTLLKAFPSDAAAPYVLIGMMVLMDIFFIGLVFQDLQQSFGRQSRRFLREA